MLYDFAFWGDEPGFCYQEYTLRLGVPVFMFCAGAVVSQPSFATTLSQPPASFAGP